ncbi:MAG: glutamate-5-semialdehyde dehydrogenase [Clostridiales bacterium]|nr:glutamate-5-semialdehyde dehydrogenase [Clostridiales bacterium]
MDNVIDKSLIEMGEKARQAAYRLAVLSSATKEEALRAIARRLDENQDMILAANTIDVEAAKKRDISAALLDRLSLNPERISSMKEGLLQVAILPDPVGEVISMWKRPNGLIIGQQRVPLGVVGIIYEARPNVTMDAAALCMKSGNATILRGGSEAINSNKAIVEVIRQGLADSGLPCDAVALVADTCRETAVKMMKMNKYIDVLIPRGGESLIRSVVENATIPVIETGTGNCHVYVDSDADFDMAEKIVINAKTSRPAVCNSAETLLVDASIVQTFLPRMLKALAACGVELRGCEQARAVYPEALSATEEDWYREYMDLIMAVKVVDDIDAAIIHINKYGSHHSDAIITNDYAKSQKFLLHIDSAAVYVNASTRFTDGNEFGFGAEIGISNQKLHARGPMGLKELTTIKYIIYGSGQVR